MKELKAALNKSWDEATNLQKENHQQIQKHKQDLLKTKQENEAKIEYVRVKE